MLIPANPYKTYEVNMTNELGDVEYHGEHLKENGRVFWDLIPPGRHYKPWAHPNIKSGYFYIAQDKVVKYWIDIEYVEQWKNIELTNVERYIPTPRRIYLDTDPKTKNYYALLIKQINPLKKEHNLEELTLVSTGTKVEHVQNYAIVFDPDWR